MKPTHLEANRDAWNRRTAAHIQSDFYNMDAFRAGETSLKDIELELLPELQDKELLHLQCHFGQDTLSLARMGAKVTGLDLSDKAIEVANQLSRELQLPAQFVQGNVLEMDQYLTQQYDIIFTTYGVVGWLQNLDKWGQLIEQHLKPGGLFLLVEFHPFVWMLDDNFEKLAYSYFNDHTFEEELTQTYTDGTVEPGGKDYSWNHSLSEVFSALLQAGLSIRSFKEYSYSPYDCFPNTVPCEKGFHLKGMEGKIPMVYAITATL